jgi:ABC-2 type transport system ATP-binding protein
MNSLFVSNVTKNYHDIRALNNVSVEIESNKIYGLLGRNGAGKTTLLNIITGKILADQGKVTLNGKEVFENDEMLRKIFMMSERNYYPEGMKVSDAFRWTKEFYRKFDEKKAVSLAEQFGLRTDRKIKSLSTGYGSIFRLIIALCVNVPFVFLDEPVLGLDANHRELFYRVMIEHYSGNPAAYIISTHLIEEVSTVIEEVIIIRNGEILLKESREDLLDKYYSVTGSISAVDMYAADKQIIGEDILGGMKTVYIEGVPDRNSVPANVEITKMDLQKLFIKLTNA